MADRGNPAVFLETLHGPANPGAGDEPTTRSEAPTLSLMSILSKLADGEAKPIIDLQVASGLEFSLFAPTVDALVKSGLVNVHGVPGQEEVQISDAGRALTAATSPGAPVPDK